MDPVMEALRDRTVKIDIPYMLKWEEERKVLESVYSMLEKPVKKKKYRSIDDPWNAE